MNTAIGNMSARITQALTDLTAGRLLIATKTAEAITAIGVATTRAAQAVSDISSGRALVGAKRTEALAALDSLDTAVTGLIPLAQGDLTLARNALSHVTDDDMAARIAQAVTDLTSARTYFNKVNIGNPEIEYIRSAAEELTAGSSFLGKARGYFNAGGDELNIANIKVGQARAYLATDETAVMHQRDAASELNIAVEKLQEARTLISLDSQAGVWGNQAMAQLRTAGAYLNQSQGYLSRFNAKTVFAKLSAYYQAWGQSLLAVVMSKVEGVKVRFDRYARGNRQRHSTA